LIREFICKVTKQEKRKKETKSSKTLAITISLGLVLLGVSVYSATTKILVGGTIADS